MKTLKALAARQVEARSRARALTVRVQVVRPEREYRSRSQSQPGVVYRISRTADGWACGCDGFHYTGCCKHLGAVARRAEREGWAFGRIARPAPAGDASAALSTSLAPGIALLTGRSL
jgi:hypothetical protein